MREAHAIADSLGPRSSVGDSPHRFTSGYLHYALAILALTNLVNYMDRMILAVVIEPIKKELVLTDTQIGLLAGFAFAIFYASFGLVIARVADRASRTRIIAVSMLAWSGITVLTGAAQNFWQLFVARIGVGIGEAGIFPAANALVADYFSPTRRAAAFAVFTAGATLGVLAGFGLGGWIAQQYGWRWAFVAAGIPGVPLSWLVWKTLRDPARGLSDGALQPSPPAGSFVSTLRALAATKTYVHVAIAGCCINFIVFGAVQWMPAFVIRRFGLDVAEVGLFFGVAVGLGAGTGTVLGGYVASSLAKRDIRWLVRIPFICAFFFLPVYLAALFSPSAAGTLSLIFLINVIGAASFGPVLAVLQSVTPAAMRATAAGVYGFAASLIGAGAAPFLIGVMSDAYAPAMGSAKSLQLAVAISMLVSIPALFHFHRAACSLARDMR